jgi:lycopene beta-cyclase
VTSTPIHDVVVLGDGPAGLALAAACHRGGLDTVVVGRDAAWTATYAAWLDEVSPREAVFASTMTMDAVGHRRSTLGRRYGVLHSGALRHVLDVAPRVRADVTVVDHLRDASVVRCDGSPGDLRARLVVDARGARAEPGVPLQTAYGLVLDERPDGIPGEGGVLMDWQTPLTGAAGQGDEGPAAGRPLPPTFLYVVDLGNGRWLVEETALAHRHPLPFDVLRQRLAARLGADLTNRARAVEHVSIPLRAGVPTSAGPTVLFGAAAGYVHPATGYSVAASLTAADRVARAITAALPLGEASDRAAMVRSAVWPVGHVRARALHDYGLAALLRLSASEIQTFFDAFFALPTDQWSTYLRIDADARAVAGVMAKVFGASPWRLRGRLAAGSPRPFLHLTRGLLRR